MLEPKLMEGTSMTQRTFNLLSWGMFFGSIGLVIIAWGGSLGWSLGDLTAYQWFPLFGLLAWCIMATHYYSGLFMVKYPTLTKPRFYHAVTGYAVLASILLHPTILANKQNEVGAGNPPESFINYVGEDLRLAVMLGSFSLILFLSFEVFDRLRKKPFIQKHWIFVSISQSLAMILIWVHAVRLGNVVGDGWFQIVWYVLGATLLPCFYIFHKLELQNRTIHKV